MATDFKLPELGEQIAGGDVLRVMVKPGDTIAKDQAVLELETDKATIEVPSSVAGVVKGGNVKGGGQGEGGSGDPDGGGGRGSGRGAESVRAESGRAESRRTESGR